ncbi:MAG: S8 family serine peptidase [Acidobacteriota bacterium]
MATHRLISSGVVAALLLAATTHASLRDLRAVESEGVVTLYAIDDDRHSLVRAAATTETTNADAFTPVALGVPLTNPLLSVDAGHLWVVDPPYGRIIELAPNPDARPQITFTSRADGTRAFAVTSRFISLASPKATVIELLDRQSRELIGVVETKAIVSHIEPLAPDRFAVAYDDVPRIDEIRRTGDAWAVVPLPFAYLAAKDFSEYEGIYYLLGNDGINVRARFVDKATRRIVASQAAREVVATRDFLFVNEGTSVRRLDRTEPVTISVEDVDGRNGPAMVAIYRYLANAGLVSQKPIASAKSFQTLDDVLEATSTGWPWWDSTFLSRDEQDSLATTLCHLNDRDCESVDALVQWLNGTNPSQVAAPDLVVSIRALTRTRTLGTTPSTYLERLPSEVRGQTTSADILRINPGTIGSFEYQVLSRGFALPPNASVALSAGSAMQFTSTALKLVTSSCASATQNVKRNYLDLPNPLESQRAEAVLPAIKPYPSAPKLRSFGVRTIRVGFDDAVVEAIDDAAIASWSNESSCQLFSDSGTFTVGRAVRLDKVRYQLLNRDGLVITPKKGDLEALNLDLRVDGDWLVPRRRSELYIGYRAFRTTANDAVVDATPKFDEARLFDEKASLRLPVAAWSISTFARSRDLESDTSSLYAIGSDSTFIFAQRELGSRAESVNDIPEPQQDDGGGVMLRDNRQKLLALIHYSEKRAEIYSDVIGVAENCSSIDFTHPDFGTGDSYAWTTSRDTPPCASTFPDSGHKIRNFVTATDHGSHVAGLLGARHGSPVAGLLPASHLAFIEKDPGENFETGVERVLATTRVISGSFSWDDSTNLKQSVRKKMIGVWSGQLLFVIAAGSDATPVRDEAQAPAIWVNDVPNLLTVGASDFSHRRYLETVPTATGQMVTQGTNFGKDFVDLFAPGMDVLSTASGSAYAKTSGSSQAVPFVAATAALLSRQITAPTKIKARLLYTADWFSSLGDDVWAGELNAERALRDPNQNICNTQSDTDLETYTATHFNPTDRVTIGSDAHPRERRKPGMPNLLPAPSSLPIESVLRIQSQRDGTFRIFYRDAGSSQLRILDDAPIFGLLRCDDGSSDPLCDSSGKFDVTNIQDYVGEVPDDSIIF